MKIAKPKSNRKMIRFIENKIFRMAIFLLAWCVFRNDKRWGGNHQEKNAGLTVTRVNGKEYEFRWFLKESHPIIERTSTDDSAKYEELIRDLGFPEKSETLSR